MNVFVWSNSQNGPVFSLKETFRYVGCGMHFCWVVDLEATISRCRSQSYTKSFSGAWLYNLQLSDSIVKTCYRCSLLY